MTSALAFQDVCLVSLTAIAGWTDSTRGIIANRVTYSTIALGLLLGFVSPPEFSARLLAVAIAFFALIQFWRASMINGGDVKLCMAVGALKGLDFLFYFWFYAFAMCLVAVVFAATRYIGVVAVVRYVYLGMMSIIMLRVPPKGPPGLEGKTIPFGLVAFFAVLVCLVLEWSGRLSPILGWS